MNQSEKDQFSRLIEASFKEKNILEIGTRFQAKVVSYNEDYVFIQVLEKKGLKGIIGVNEFEVRPEIGNIIEVFFLKESYGDFYFTHCMYDNITINSLKLAFDCDIPVWGKVQSNEEGGYKVKIGQIDGFCPKSQFKIENEKKILGNKFKFLVIKIAKSQILVSYKSFQDKEKKAKKLLLKKELKENMFVDCKVISIKPSGLLVDMNGINGFVPISEASFKRKPDLEKEFKIGQSLKAKILSLNWEENKYILTIKDFLEDPWLKNLPYKEDTVIKGTVEEIKNFGLLVKLDEYFTGLVSVRETNVDIRSPLYQFFKKGQQIEVVILKIDPEKKQLLLSIQKAQELKEKMEYQEYLSDYNKDEGYSLGDVLRKQLDKKN